MKRSLPYFHLVAVEQYGNDNEKSCCTGYDDCYYDCTVCNYAWNKHRHRLTVQSQCNTKYL